jgi:hypothetical protein
VEAAAPVDLVAALARALEVGDQDQGAVGRLDAVVHGPARPPNREHGGQGEEGEGIAPDLLRGRDPDDPEEQEHSEHA